MTNTYYKVTQQTYPIFFFKEVRSLGCDRGYRVARVGRWERNRPVQAKLAPGAQSPFLQGSPICVLGESQVGRRTQLPCKYPRAAE